MLPRNQNSNKIRNIAFVGTTGNGKSSCCNTISGRNPGPFQVGHDHVSCTEGIEDYVCESKKVRLFDMPGFGDNRFCEKRIDGIIRQLGTRLINPTVDSTNQIDAFVIVTKLNPKPQTLKSDLEHIRHLFGTVAFRSIILLLIYPSEVHYRGDFLEKLVQMHDIVRILREGKQEEPNEDWFCVWDNNNPREGQEEELMRKIERLEPYTHQKFLEGEREIKERINNTARKELEARIARIKGMSEEDARARQIMIKEVEQQCERERRELIESREKAEMEAYNLVTSLQAMQQEEKETMRLMYLQMENERKESQEKIYELMKKNQKQSQQQIAELNRNSKAMTEFYLTQIRNLIDRSKNNTMIVEESQSDLPIPRIVKGVLKTGVELVGGMLSCECNMF